MMASSNPFRRKSTITTTATAPTSGDSPVPLGVIDTSVATPPPQTSFRNEQLPNGVVVEEKSKPVKQVRIISPPPLSPDSPEWGFAAQPLSFDGGQLRNSTGPIEWVSTDDSDRNIVPSPAQAQNNGRVPPNPFSKTLKDIESTEGEHELKMEREEEGAALKAANMNRRSLDVNTFKRLLMTGNSETDTTSTPPKAHQLKLGHQRSATEAFSASQVSYGTYGDFKDTRQPRAELHDTSLISNDVSENPSNEADEGNASDSSMSVQFTKGKKPPPPPSSRHGKSIRLELKEEPDALERPRSKSPSDVNKPLPPAPVRKSLDEAESPFDRESAGKVPEVDAPASSQYNWDSGKRAVPAPPPRRGHARAESKLNVASVSNPMQPIQKNHEDETPSRTSMDSVRSRPDRSRHEGHVVAPPPPPRRSTGSRQSSHTLSTVPDSFDGYSSSLSTPRFEADRSAFAPPLQHTTSLDTSTFRDFHSATGKLSAPPPLPPARNSSVRRPASVRSIESTSRRVSADKGHNAIAPPPPPRRQRGNSRDSQDGQQPQRTSFDVTMAQATPSLPEESMLTTEDRAAEGTDRMSPQSAVDAGKSVDILADLDALQREVDALRGKLG